MVSAGGGAGMGSLDIYLKLQAPLSDQEDIKVQCHLQFTRTPFGDAGLAQSSGALKTPGK